MFKALTAAATALVLGAATPVPATPAVGSGEWALIQAIRATGTTVYLQCPPDAAFSGVYMSEQKIMGICVDGRDPSDWTADEKDTLRHEAVHLVQDCMGALADNSLDTVHRVTDLMRLVGTSGIPADRIEDVYRMHGADDMTVLLELEAFAMAASHTPEEISGLVKEACLTPRR